MAAGLNEVFQELLVGALAKFPGSTVPEAWPGNHVKQLKKLWGEQQVEQPPLTASGRLPAAASPLAATSSATPPITARPASPSVDAPLAPVTNPAEPAAEPPTAEADPPAPVDSPARYEHTLIFSFCFR